MTSRTTAWRRAFIVLVLRSAHSAAAFVPTTTGVAPASGPLHRRHDVCLTDDARRTTADYSPRRTHRLASIQHVLDCLYMRLYKYSFAPIENSMPLAAPLASTTAAGIAPRARVAIAGATGFAGQELVRILARHPAVTLTAAMSSGATSTPRPLPALARIWDGAIVPLDIERLVADADIVFLALPEAASAELAPVLVERGRRVIDLSGAFRIRDDAARARWYPATTALPAGTV